MPLLEEFEQQGNFLFRYRSILPVPFLGIGLLIYAWNAYHKLFPDWVSSYEFVCLTIGLLGQLVRILTVGYTPKGTSGRNTEKQVAEVVNTKGIYSVVRHPLYVGNFLMWLSVGMLTTNLWFIVCFVLAYWLYYERIMYAEEEFLRKKFGSVYVTWASATPAFIPDLSKFQRAELDFSLKNVLKREYNGFFALILIFTVFVGIRYYFETKTLFLPLIWQIIFAVGTISFLILKILKKFTKLLDVAGR